VTPANVVGARTFGGATIFITGGAGFIASSIIRQLRDVPCRVRRLVRTALPPDPASSGGAVVVEDIVGDVREPETWHRGLDGVDVVLHLAAQTSLYAADRDPAADFAVNVAPLRGLLDACRARGGRPTVVAAGTVTVVGLTTDATPLDESRPDAPITFYDVHKLMAEQYLELFTREGWLSAVTLRLANVYGPGTASSSRDRGILNLMVRRALAGEPLTVYGTGAYVRDYVYVDDVARAFLAAAASIDAVRGQHLLVGSGRGTPIAAALRMVADRAARATGTAPDVQFVAPPPGLSPIEVRSFVADTRRLQALTGWSAQVGLEEGVDRTIAAYRGTLMNRSGGAA